MATDPCLFPFWLREVISLEAELALPDVPDLDPDSFLYLRGVEVDWAAVQERYPYQPELWRVAAEWVQEPAPAVPLRRLWPRRRKAVRRRWQATT